MTTTLSARQLAMDEPYMDSGSAQSVAIGLDIVSADRLGERVVPPPQAGKSEFLATSTSFVPTWISGAVLPRRDETWDVVFTSSGSTVLLDRPSAMISLYETDFPGWLGAELETPLAVFRVGDDKASWLQMASDLFAGARKMTGEERRALDDIVRQWNRPLEAPPRTSRR